MTVASFSAPGRCTVLTFGLADGARRLDVHGAWDDGPASQPFQPIPNCSGFLSQLQQCKLDGWWFVFVDALPDS
jgi:hypothetical protein